jgi:hypothetical protein
MTFRFSFRGIRRVVSGTWLWSGPGRSGHRGPWPPRPHPPRPPRPHEASMPYTNPRSWVWRQVLETPPAGSIRLWVCLDTRCCALRVQQRVSGQTPYLADGTGQSPGPAARPRIRGDLVFMLKRSWWGWWGGGSGWGRDTRGVHRRLVHSIYRWAGCLCSLGQP